MVIRPLNPARCGCHRCGTLVIARVRFVKLEIAVARSAFARRPARSNLWPRAVFPRNVATCRELAKSFTVDGIIGQSWRKRTRAVASSVWIEISVNGKQRRLDLTLLAFCNSNSH